jgi:hypothetical protein
LLLLLLTTVVHLILSLLPFFVPSVLVAFVDSFSSMVAATAEDEQKVLTEVLPDEL